MTKCAFIGLKKKSNFPYIQTTETTWRTRILSMLCTINCDCYRSLLTRLSKSFLGSALHDALWCALDAGLRRVHTFAHDALFPRVYIICVVGLFNQRAANAAWWWPTLFSSFRRTAPVTIRHLAINTAHTTIYTDRKTYTCRTQCLLTTEHSI